MDDAITCIGEQSPARALQLLDRADTAAASVATFGERGRIVSELELADLRESLVGSYRMIYRARADRITIVAFVPTARDLSQLRRAD